MQEKKLQKTFAGEFDKLLEKVQKKENFAFSRFSDGELFMLKGEKLELREDGFTTGDRSGPGVYTSEEQKYFDPEAHHYYRDKLIECLKHRQHNYFKGLTGVVDEDIAGEDSFQFQLDMHGEGDDEHLTFANVLINNNYPRFINEMFPLIKERKIVMICNEACDFGGLAFEVKKDFRVGTNCIINDYGKIQEVKDWIRNHDIKDHVFLFSASTLSNYMIHGCYKEFPDNTYIDIGSAVNPRLGISGWMHSRAYLQHWVLGRPNKYGVQEDVWS